MSDEIVLSFDPSVKGIIRTDWDVADDVAKKIINEAEARQDPHYALDALRVLRRMDATSGLVKAQILYYLNKNWHRFGIEETFLHSAIQYGMNSPMVAKRYVDVWAMFEERKIPEEYIEQIKHKPINDLVPIMGTLKLGYDISDEQWKELVRRTSHTDVADYLRTEVKKVQPRTQTILFHVDKDTDMLIATNQGKPRQVAKLNLHSTDEVVQVSIHRILHALGVEA